EGADPPRSTLCRVSHRLIYCTISSNSLTVLSVGHRLSPNPLIHWTKKHCTRSFMPCSTSVKPAHDCRALLRNLHLKSLGQRFVACEMSSWTTTPASTIRSFGRRSDNAFQSCGPALRRCA